MSAYFTKLYGCNKEDVEAKAKDYMNKLDYMRQPTLYGIELVDPKNPKGEWVAIVKYWGLD